MTGMFTADLPGGSQEIIAQLLQSSAVVVQAVGGSGFPALNLHEVLDKSGRAGYRIFSNSLNMHRDAIALCTSSVRWRPTIPIPKERSYPC